MVERILNSNNVFRGSPDVCPVYKVPIKVSLSHKTLTDYVYSKLRLCCDDLKHQSIFLHDVDYTHEIQGTFEKEEFIEYLLSEGFSFDQTNSTRQIVQNDSKVSQWCLTFYDTKNIFNEKLRGKFYGKAISQMTSGKVMDDFIGVNIHYFIKPEDERLQKAFKKTCKTGITRIEFTVYCNELPVLDNLHRYCDYMFDLCEHSECYMKVPHSKIWEEICKKIKHSCCIHFPKSGHLYFGIGKNSVTGRIMGTQTTSAKHDLVQYALNQLPLPKTTVHYLEILPLVDTDQSIRKIKIKQKMFYKPDVAHFLFKKRTPRWVCKSDEGESWDYRLFDKIFGAKFLALWEEEPENGFEKVIQKSKKQMRRIVFDSVIVRQALPKYCSSQNLSRQTPQATKVRTDEPSFARQYEQDIENIVIDSENQVAEMQNESAREYQALEQNMKAQIDENSVVIESMRHEVSQAKSDKAKTEDQVLIRDLQINEAERTLEVMRQAREEAERLVAIERQARQEAERLSQERQAEFEMQAREAERLSQERQADLIRQNNELRAALVLQNHGQYIEDRSRGSSSSKNGEEDENEDMDRH